MKKWLWFLLIAAILHKISAGSLMANSTDDLLARHKRTLIYNINGGVAKFVMSILIPVALPKMQSLNWAINLQAQYLVPDMSFYNPWQLSRSSSGRKRRMTNGDDHPDSDYSREFIYSLIETVLSRHKKNGRACLERAICEVSQHPVAGNGHGFLGDIVDAIFIPPKGSTDDPAYYDAHLAGVAGVDCLQQFSGCPREDGILERFSVVI